MGSGIIVRIFPEKVNWVGRHTLTGQHHPVNWIKQEEEMEYQHPPLCLGWMQCDSLRLRYHSCSCSPPCLPPWTVSLKTESQITRGSLSCRCWVLVTAVWKGTDTGSSLPRFKLILQKMSLICPGREPDSGSPLQVQLHCMSHDCSFANVYLALFLLVFLISDVHCYCVSVCVHDACVEVWTFVCHSTHVEDRGSFVEVVHSEHCVGPGIEPGFQAHEASDSVLWAVLLAFNVTFPRNCVSFSKT